LGGLVVKVWRQYSNYGFFCKQGGFDSQSTRGYRALWLMASQKAVISFEMTLWQSRLFANFLTGERSRTDWMQKVASCQFSKITAVPHFSKKSE
ncbi:MAG: hypothetical protein ABR523_12260, partial [Desulfurivibrionaceae bacterium]